MHLLDAREVWHLLLDAVSKKRGLPAETAGKKQKLPAVNFICTQSLLPQIHLETMDPKVCLVCM